MEHVDYVTGQRWLSETEPEMGLGSIIRIEDRSVTITFPANEVIRTYSCDSAPLTRVRFGVGDEISDDSHNTFRVAEVWEQDGLLYYSGEGIELCETDLSSTLSFSKPEERLARGQQDSSHAFDLRLETLYHQQEIQQSPVRGLLGSRITLIPHQMYIVHEVSNRALPRVLLADEVGLGKTIEACLIMHHLMVTGQAQRALIIVPESLVHQWFVELLRRFNLTAAIYDESRCQAIEENPESGNPFLDEQLILCSLEFLNSGRRGHQAADIDWDLLIVDEAHHLAWSVDAPSAEYQLIEGLAAKSTGLLLLTATPEEIGPESHFARLRLLDPVRYSNLEKFFNESDDSLKLVPLLEHLETGKELSKADHNLLASMQINEELSDADKIHAVLDRYGPGRVIFRNTRRRIKGFPKRVAHLEAVGGNDNAKVQWLAEFIKKIAPDKALLICHSPEQVLELQQKLQHLMHVKTAVFHEHLSLIQRDRNAAWFAEDDGAQLLIASEVGGEGRNFQFVHHLVLYDLPENPEVLEQRIGRLDRIGQKHQIEIHVPFLEGSREETLAHWYNDALEAFSQPLQGAYKIFKRYDEQLANTTWSKGAAWESLVSDARGFKAELQESLNRGHDSLLAQQSFKEKEAKELISEIREWDQSPQLETYMLRVFEHYGIRHESIGLKSHLLQADHLFTDAFPLPRDGATVTFARKRALDREELTFLTWDHPMVTSAMELILSSHDGNSAKAVWPSTDKRRIMLECAFLTEPLAQPKQNVHRYVPQTPIRVIVDHNFLDCTSELDRKTASSTLVDGTNQSIFERNEIYTSLLPGLVNKAKEIAESRLNEVCSHASTKLQQEAEVELERLKALQKVNDHISEEEMSRLRSRFKLIESAISGTSLRLDAVRLIWNGPLG